MSSKRISWRDITAKKWRKLWFLAAILGALMLVWATVDLPSIEQLQAYRAQLGWWAPLVAGAVYAAAALLLVPSTPLNIAVGVLFGWLGGGVIAMSGVAVAATIGYFIGRSPAVAVRDGISWSWLERHPLVAVMLARVVGVLPFGPTNLAFGAARVPVRKYLVGTMIGTMPGTLANVAVGAFGAQWRSWPFWVAVGVSVTCAAVGIWWSRRTGRGKSAH